MERASILIAEDERLVAMALQDRLEQIGHRIVGNVSSGEQAIEEAGRYRPALVLMDIRLGGQLDGVETAKIIRERFHIPSIFLTAYSDDATLQRAKLSEPFGYIVKPFDSKLLEVTIEVALYRQRLERERALDRARLRASEARYRSLAALSPVGIFHTDISGRYVYVNERWALTSGLPVADAPGDGWARAIHPEDRDRVRSRWREAVENCTEFYLEHRFQRPDGSVRHVLTQALPEVTSEGELAGYIGTVTDLTELRGVQERLERSERQRRVAANHLPILMSSVDTTLRYRAANGDIETWFGVSAEQVVGREMREVLGPALFERVAPHLRRVLDGERTDFVLDVDSADRGQRWLNVTLVPDVGPSGVVEGFFSLSLDVTRQKEEEMARRRTEIRHTAILDNSPDAIISVDPSYEIVVFNKAAERIFGFDAGEVLGESLDVLIPGEMRKTHRSQVSRFGDTQGDKWHSMGGRTEIAGRRKGGACFPMEAVVGKSEHQGEALFTVIVRDVSDKKRLEEQYLQAQKMEALGRLAGGVAHDFNNVLSSIMSHVELLKLDLSERDPMQEELNEVLEGCGRAAALTRQLLVFSRRQVLEPRVVDMAGILTGMEKMLRRILGEDVDLTVSMSNGPLVLIDPGQLEQVVMNLVVNARDAMPRGGELRIEVGEEEVSEAHANAAGGIPPGDYAVLTVTDTGCGMEQEVLSHAFEPFFTTKGEGKGAGLGLSTVFGIVGKANGRVSAESSPGNGARFTIHLQKAHGTASKEELRDEGSLKRGAETILVVEDDENVCGPTSAILERSGYTVLRATSGKDALVIADGYDGPIHLLLSDVVMPRMNGRQLSKRLHEQNPMLKTLFMSGYVGDPALGETLSKEQIIQKPFTAAELTTRVRHALDAGLSPRGQTRRGWR
jgi:two-component system, cell cycle sensor histidine kinase and response regulator CckA